MRKNEIMQLTPSSGNQYDYNFFGILIHKRNELVKYKLRIYYVQDPVLRARNPHCIKEMCLGPYEAYVIIENLQNVESVLNRPCIFCPLAVSTNF